MREQTGPRTLGELLTHRAATHGDRVAVVDETERLTYAELAARARAAARVLSGRGVRPRDRVVVQGRNEVAWVVAAYGALLAGATVVPLGARVAENERTALLEQLAPRLVVADEPSAAMDRVERVGLAQLMHLATGARAAAGTVGDLGWVDPGDQAIVICSSGTSGRVKAVPMAHWQLLRMYDDTRLALGAREDDVWAGVVPVTHSFGFNGVLLVALLAGASVRLMADYQRAQLARWVAAGEVNVLAGPPAIYHDLADQLDTAAPALRYGIVGSTEVSATEMAGLARRLGVPRFVTGYGMTETCGTVAIGDLDPVAVDPTPWMPLMPGVEARVCDASGRDLPVGAAGRILVRGYNLTRPYAAAPDLLPGGWFDTGDVGRLDGAGRLAVTGRVDDMVIVSGFNVHPAEVETVLREHPGVAQAGVVGIRDPRTGHRLAACVVPADPGNPPDREVLRTWVRDRLSPYKVPSEVVLLDALPATATGKLSRVALRRAVTDARSVSAG